VVEVKSYVVNAERSGGWWAFTVPEVPGAFGQAKRLDQVKGEARDVIAMMADVDPDSIEVKLVPKLSVDAVTADDLQRLLDGARDARKQLEDDARHAQEATLEAAQQLSKMLGLSIRDIGTLLEVSFQRVGQILSSKPKGKVH
jgi:hypothetical protein